MSVAPKLGARPALDGIRGIGVSVVVIAHALYPVMPSMAAFVDVFFVLSGFLITTLLLEEDRKTSRVDVGRFYRRRVRRLFPLLYITILGTVVGIVAVRLIHGGGTQAVFPDSATYDELVGMALNDALAGGLYVYHVVHPVGIELLTGTWPEFRPLIPLWSLGVEEHFYFFGVLFILLVMRRNWIRQAIVVLAGAFIFIGAARAMGHVGPRLAWYQRPDGLVLGVLLAYVNAHIPESATKPWEKHLRWAIGIATFCWAFVIFLGTKGAQVLERALGQAGLDVQVYIPFHPTWGDTPEGVPSASHPALEDGLFWGRFGFTICALFAAVVVFGLARTRGSRLERALSVGPATALGRRSYGIYIIHMPLAMIVFNLFRDIPVLVLSYLPLLALLVEVGHRYLEKPLMRDRVPRPAAASAAPDTSAPPDTSTPPAGEPA